MLDAFTKVVSQADVRGEYVSATQIDALAQVVKDGTKYTSLLKGVGIHLMLL